MTFPHLCDPQHRHCWRRILSSWTTCDASAWHLLLSLLVVLLLALFSIALVNCWRSHVVTFAHSSFRSTHSQTLTPFPFHTSASEKAEVRTTTTKGWQSSKQQFSFPQKFYFSRRWQWYLTHVSFFHSYTPCVLPYSLCNFKGRLCACVWMFVVRIANFFKC